MSIASHYQGKAREYASGTEGTTYATLLVAHEQQTANLIAYARLIQALGIEHPALHREIQRRLGLEE